MEIFIPFNVPSLKNSKIKTSRGIFPSKTVNKYLQNLGIQKYSSRKKEVVEYKTRPNLFREIFENINWKKPEGLIKIGFHFVRKTKAKFDYINGMQLPLDLLTAHDYIKDDNCDYVIPYIYKKNGQYYSVDSENPGLYLEIQFVEDWKSRLKDNLIKEIPDNFLTLESKYKTLSITKEEFIDLYLTNVSPKTW